MKALKIYFIVATVMLCLAIGTGVYVWYMYQTYTRDIEQQVTPVVSDTQSDKAIVEDTKEANSIPPSEETVANTAEPITIDATKLTDTQRDILKSFGYTGDSLSVTRATVACAEDALGNARFAQILGGAAPTPLEAMQLLPCMKQ